MYVQTTVVQTLTTLILFPFPPVLFFGCGYAAPGFLWPLLYLLVAAMPQCIVHSKQISDSVPK